MSRGVGIFGQFSLWLPPGRDEGQGNVKVECNLANRCIFKTTKSEIRISKYETILKFEYQMTKTLRELIQYLQGLGMF